MAVAVDTSGGADGTGSTLTKSLTLAGSDIVLLVVGTTRSATNDITGCTWNGAAMTQIDSFDKVSGVYHFRTFVMWAAESGTHDVVLSRSGSGTDIELAAVSYNGVPNTAFDAQATDSSSGTSFSGSLTTVDDLSQVVFLIGGTNGSQTAGTDTLKVVQDDQVVIMSGDGTTTPAGSQTLAWSSGSSVTENFWSEVSLSPEAGSLIKTVNGLARASVKTVNGLAIASVKNYNGLA